MKLSHIHLLGIGLVMLGPCLAAQILIALYQTWYHKAAEPDEAMTAGVEV